MIDVRLLSSEANELVGFLMTGHADFDERGYDVVCASVSSVAYFAANTITDVMEVPARVAVSEDDEHPSFTLIVSDNDAARCRDILKGFELHIKSLAEQCPDYIKVNYLEVQENA